MIKDYFTLALRNLMKRKLRSWLTMLGIFVSIAAIFTLISLSLWLQSAIEEQFRQLGTDKFFIQPKGGFGPGSQGAVELTIKDFDFVSKISGIKQAGYLVSASAKIEFNKKTRFLPVFGIDEEGIDVYMESSAMKMDEGKAIDGKPNQKIIIGSDFKYRNVFSKEVFTWDKLSINDAEFKVSGIIAPIGNPSDDKNIIMGVEDFRNFFGIKDRVDYMILQVDSGADIKEVVDRVENKLMKFRGLNEKTIDFVILTPEELLTSFGTILNIITAFLISVAGISLIVGAVGIANTMYTSVLERTKEIGVMKAIGAKNSDVLWIFIIESGLLGALGGIIGVLFGVLISKGLEYYAINFLGTTLLKAATPFYLIAGCILFAFIIGAASGFFPARQASKTNVVDALRYE